MLLCGAQPASHWSRFLYLFEDVLVYNCATGAQHIFLQVLVCRACTVCVQCHAYWSFQREATELTLSLRHVSTSNRAFELLAVTSTTSHFSNPVTYDPGLASDCPQSNSEESRTSQPPCFQLIKQPRSLLPTLATSATPTLHY